MDNTRPPPGATSSTIDAQLDQQPTKQAHITIIDTHQLSNTATPNTDEPLTQLPSNDTSSTTNAQTQCLLFRLSGELRNMVYDHVFGTGIVEGHIQLDVAHTLAPQSDLTIACRRIHKETTAMHQAAFKTYWRTTSSNSPCLWLTTCPHLPASVSST
jgi:hypothetical protein